MNSYIGVAEYDESDVLSFTADFADALGVLTEYADGPVSELELHGAMRFAAHLYGVTYDTVSEYMREWRLALEQAGEIEPEE